MSSPAGAHLCRMRRRRPSFAVLTDAAGANRRPKRPEFFNKTSRGRSIAERGDTWRLRHPIEVQTDPGIEPQRREKGSLVVEGVCLARRCKTLRQARLPPTSSRGQAIRATGARRRPSAFDGSCSERASHSPRHHRPRSASAPQTQQKEEHDEPIVYILNGRIIVHRTPGR